MEFEFKLTKEYLLDFHMKYYLRTKTFLDVKIGFTLIMIIYWSFAYFIIDTKYKIVVIITFFIFILLYIILKKRYYAYLAKKQILKSLDNYKNKFLFLPTTITMDDNGMYVDTKFSTKLIEWTIIENFHIIENNIIIRAFGNKNIIFIPSECFSNNENLSMLIDLLKKIHLYIQSIIILKILKFNK